MQKNLTKRTVESLKPHMAAYDTPDAAMPAFGVRVWPSGRLVYFVRFRSSGVRRRYAIGLHGPVTCEQARRTARRILSEAAQGGDPAGTRHLARTAPTVAEFCKRYLTEHAEPKKRPSSVAQDRRMIERHILPALGRRKLADVNRDDVQRLHHRLRAAPFYANRVLALMSTMLNLAAAWGLRHDGSNPCRHVMRYKEPARARFVSEVELARLGAVLAQAEREGTEAPAIVAAIRLLVLTGCRLGEILTLRWEHVDFERGELRLLESKTGPKTVPLNAPARELLAGLARDESGFAIPGRNHGRHLVNLSKPWHRIRERAGLADVRLHDLRHSFASIGAGGGLSLPVIGALLGHTQAATTKRYAHIADDPLRAATEMIGRRIAAAWGAQGGEVVELPRRK